MEKYKYKDKYKFGLQNLGFTQDYCPNVQVKKY